MEVLDVLEGKVRVVREEPSSPIKDLASCRLLVNDPFQLGHCRVDIASESATLASLHESLAHTTKSVSWLAFALNAPHRADVRNPHKGYSPRQQLCLCRIALLHSPDLIVLLARVLV
jgi:hypothetical protein